MKYLHLNLWTFGIFLFIFPLFLLMHEPAMAQTAVPNPVCYGQPINLICNLPGCESANATYIWSNKSGTWSSDEKNPVILSGTTGYASDRFYLTVNYSPPPGGFSGGSVMVTVLAPFVEGSASANQTICSGAVPSALTATAPSGGKTPYSYQWQNSANNITFSDITGATDLSYQPPALTSTTWFRVTQTSSADCGSVYTNAVKITVLTLVPAGVSVSASANPVNPGTLVTFTAIPVNGGTQPAFQWKVNGTPVTGATGNPYIYIPANSDVVQCVMTSSATCVTGNPAISEPLIMEFYGSIGGVKFSDTDGDGVKDPDEQLLAGWEITLMGSNGVVLTQMTGSNGAYLFGSLDAIFYQISETQQDCWEPTYPPGGTYQVSLNSGQVITDLNFGNKPVEISMSCVSYPPPCFGGKGYFTLLPTGGTPPYSIDVSPCPPSVNCPFTNVTNPFQTPPLFPAGNYTFHITDAGGCDVYSYCILTEPPPMTSSYVIVPAGCRNNIDVTTQGGIPPYGYQWSTASMNEDLYDLPGGPYTVTITDAQGCPVILTVTVPDNCDFGDAPDHDLSGPFIIPYPTLIANQGACAIKTTDLYLGFGPPDTEPDGQPFDIQSNGDDMTSMDDEDGVTIPPLFPGPNTITVYVKNTTGAIAYLSGWIDLNQDRIWDDFPPEKIIDGQQVISTAGVQTLTFIVFPPVNPFPTVYYARFRISDAPQIPPVNLSGSYIPQGEVEDYTTMVINPVPPPDSCHLDSLKINTGINRRNNNALLNLGAYDSWWKLRRIPTQYLYQDAIVSDVNYYWSILPDSRWDGVTANSGTQNALAGDYRYSFSFCLNQTQDVSLTMTILADNGADIYLNGLSNSCLIGTLPGPAGFQSPALTITYSGNLFKTGLNYLNVVVHNDPGWGTNPTGFTVSGTLYSPLYKAIGYRNCCDYPGPFYLTDVAISAAACYYAWDTISTGGGGRYFTIHGNGSCQLISEGGIIALHAGSRVFPGGSLWAAISNIGCETEPDLPAVGPGTLTDSPPFTETPGLRLWPNPTHRNFTIALKEGLIADHLRVEVYDIRGNRVLYGEMQGVRQHEFDLAAMPEGLYYVKITGNGITEILKLIKLK